MIPPSWKVIIRLRGKDEKVTAISQPIYHPSQKELFLITYITTRDIPICSWKGYKRCMGYSPRCCLLEMHYCCIHPCKGSSWCYTHLFWCGGAAAGKQGGCVVGGLEQSMGEVWGGHRWRLRREWEFVFLFRGASIIHLALFLAEHQSCMRGRQLPLPTSLPLPKQTLCAKELYMAPYRQSCLAGETAECIGQAHDEQVACCREGV